MWVKSKYSSMYELCVDFYNRVVTRCLLLLWVLMYSYIFTTEEIIQMCIKKLLKYLVALRKAVVCAGWSLFRTTTASQLPEFTYMYNRQLLRIQGFQERLPSACCIPVALDPIQVLALEHLPVSNTQNKLLIYVFCVLNMGRPPLVKEICLQF